MDISKTNIRGHLRMRGASPLTGAADELVSESPYDRSSRVAAVRLLEPAGNYPAGTTLYVGSDEFVAD